MSRLSAALNVLLLACAVSGFLATVLLLSSGGPLLFRNTSHYSAIAAFAAAVVAVILVVPAGFLVGYAAVSDPRQVWQAAQVSDYVGSPAAPSAASPPVEGSREVWVLPVHGPGQVPMSEAEVLERMPRQLRWFTVTSRGKFSFELTRVLPPHTVSSDDCVAQRAFFDEFVDDLEQPTGVHVVGLLAAECSWRGLGTLDSARVLLSDVTAAKPWSMGVLVHELGHNLGLSHAQRSSCPALLSESDLSGLRLWSSPVECGVVEYGDTTSPMGPAPVGYPPLFNAVELLQLGWGDGLSFVDSGRVRLLPVAADGPDGVTFTAADGSEFVLSLRAAVPNDVADGSFSGDPTLVMHWRASSLDSWLLVPFRRNYPGARLGDSWVTPDGSVALRVVSLGRTAVVDIDRAVSGRWRDSWAPHVTSEVSVAEVPGFDAAAPAALVTVSWQVQDSSGIKSVRVRVGGRMWRMPPGPGLLPAMVSRGESLSATLIVKDRAGNITRHAVNWSR